MWDYSVFWQEAVNQLRLELTEQEFALWFQNMQYEESEENSIIITVPSSFYRDQVRQRYVQKLETKITELFGNRLEILFNIKKPDVVHQPAAKQQPVIPDPIEDQVAKSSSLAIVDKKPHPQLNSKYTFENFIIGENNSFAANAAIAIAQNPGKCYNPCLIYGGVGLGKTHLLQSIGNRAHQLFNDKKIVYITAETFTNEFILSINERKQSNFKNKYRSVDILLVDDIHFLQNKNETQEELFHTFNALYENNKHMIFTCDRPVSELKNLSDRLRSRFERGLNVDMQPPNYETRVAILLKKIADNPLQISPDVLELISKHVTTNVRDLEAALTKLIAYAELVNKKITLEIAQQQLKDIFSSPKQSNITIDTIQRVVAEYFNLSHNDLRGKKRTKAIAFPRQVAMYIAREMTEYSTTEVGLDFGGRDHTTVMHACQKIDERLRTDPTFEPIIKSLIRSIKEYGLR